MDIFDLVAVLTLDKSGYEDGLSEAQGEASSFGDKLGTAAKVGAGAMTAVTAATAAAGAAFVKGAGDVASYGDTIDKQSQKMGISAEAYQEWDAVLQHSGTSISSLQRGMTTLAKAAEKGDDSFAQLGITQSDLQSMNQEELFAKTIEGLQSMESGTERTVLAQKLLGGSAKELGALLNTSAEDTQAMKDRVHELGGVMSDDAVKAAASYQDSLQDMNTAIDGVKRGIMSEFLPSLTSAMDGIGNLFSGDSETGLGQIKEGVSAFISKLSEIIPRVIEIGGQILGALSQAIIENLPALLDAGIQSISTLAQGIAKALPELIPAIVDAVLTMVDTLIDNIDLLIDAALQLMIGLANGLIKAIPKIIEKIPQIITSIVKALVGAAPQIASAGVQLLGALITNLPQIIVAIVGAIPEIIKGIVDAFADGIEKMKEVGGKLLTSIGAGIKDNWEKLKTRVTNLKDNILNVFKNIGKLFENIGKNLLTGFANGLVNIKSLFDRFRSIQKNIIDFFKDLPKNFVTIGKNLLTGLGNGIVEGAKGVIEKAKSVASSVVSGVMGIFGENSPSKVFHKIGGYLMEGMANGIDSNMGMVEDAMDEMGDVVYSEAPATDFADTTTTTTSFGNDGSTFAVPRSSEPRQLTVVLELNRTVLGRMVYEMNNEETQRVGVQLAGGFA